MPTLAATDANALHWTYGLRDVEGLRALAEAIPVGAGGRAEQSLIEAVAELLAEPPSARVAVEAVRALAERDGPLVGEALSAALAGRYPIARLAAARALADRGAGRRTDWLARLRADVSWPVRRAALRALADGSPERLDTLLIALDDPHWRVRHALLRVLLERSRDGQSQTAIDAAVARAEGGVRGRGLRAILRRRWLGEPIEPAELLAGPDPSRRCPLWDWDPPVLCRAMDAGDPQELLASAAFLLGHDDERIRDRASAVLREVGGIGQLVEAIGLLAEPRAAAVDTLRELLARLDTDRLEAAARQILHSPTAEPATLAWALDQIGPVFPADEERTRLAELLAESEGLAPSARAAMARLLGRCPELSADAGLASLLSDTDDSVVAAALSAAAQRGLSVDRDRLAAESDELRTQAVATALRLGAGELLSVVPSDQATTVRKLAAAAADRLPAELAERLRADRHPHVRAAGLSPARAAELVAEPGCETSWHVLSAAARLAKVPIWRLAPSRPRAAVAVA